MRYTGASCSPPPGETTNGGGCGHVSVRNLNRILLCIYLGDLPQKFSEPREVSKSHFFVAHTHLHIDCRQQQDARGNDASSSCSSPSRTLLLLPWLFHIRHSSLLSHSLHSHSPTSSRGFGVACVLVPRAQQWRERAEGAQRTGGYVLQKCTYVYWQ